MWRGSAGNSSSRPGETPAGLLEARDAAGTISTAASPPDTTRIWRPCLLVPQRIHGVEPGGLDRRPDAEEQPDADREAETGDRGERRNDGGQRRQHPHDLSDDGAEG